MPIEPVQILNADDFSHQLQSVFETPDSSASTSQCLGCGRLSAGTDERGVGLGDLHRFRDLANLLAPEQWLTSREFSIPQSANPAGS